MPTNNHVQKEKFAEDRALLSQQNKEYAESLAKDIAKKEEKDKIRFEAEQKELRKKTIQDYREKLKGTVSQGPLRLLVRYPNGSRLILSFSPSQPMTSLFDAIILNPACPDYFSVRSVYPRAEIHCYPAWYHTIFNAEFKDETEKGANNVAKETNEVKCLETIPNNSILYVNLIQ
ncbi:UBX domain-containing protein 5 [Caenorhabditis elegans]|uniref:UBX domain-containing protein 5 n=1 Tax=Caenorhabditis elegans TaxID=6239 RepID=UBXN5_CAEEL|nr:UBX domain-containing protein 5 [Caenorhabditis elegans]Q7YWU9.1 RecName: Full=UBX domain-containing protein 5 [Caenorhabditis elegans]CAE17928.1 UBX domain-containing protein 5 [Caenorhabditis elegans]|eukprot:NP_001022300.1 UBX domain-containing protein 5 [Caenorhabditis elegans]